MIVYNENQKEAFEIFKNTCDISQYVSFDCEMTGINLGTKTDGTQYDTQEFRYYKQRQVVSKFDLIQIGLTFYQEKEKKIEKEPEKGNEKKEKEYEEKKYYLERTFLFYLYKNSKLKMINDELFDSELRAHPAALKFLGDSNFDFNILIKKGINFNKLQNKEKIKNALNEKKLLLSNGAMFLSKENESELIEKVILLTDYILQGKTNTFELKFNNKHVLIFFLGINFKKLLSLDGFIITKSFIKENTITITKKENLQIKDFEDKYQSFENFKLNIKNDINKIYQSRYQLGCFGNEEIIEQITNEELGFSRFIEYLCEKKIPIIGHNIYYDMMFLYDKLIGDLPEDFYSFKKEIHKYFPIIYDTKYISTTLTQQYKKCNIEKTALNNVYKTILKNRYDIYVDFFPDAPNGFCLYNDMERDKLHDAGYDSIITGRCFVLLNKALENGFEITNINKQSMGIAGQNLGEKEEVVIKYGFIDKNIFEQYANKTFMSLVENENGIIKWNVGNNGQIKEEYIRGENELINGFFKNVFMVKFKISEDTRIINIYEIANIFENEDFDISVVKSDSFSAFVEFSPNDDKDEKETKKIEELVEKVKKDNENNDYKWKIEKIYNSKEFYENYKMIINVEQ